MLVVSISLLILYNGFVLLSAAPETFGDICLDRKVPIVDEERRIEYDAWGLHGIWLQVSPAVPRPASTEWEQRKTNLIRRIQIVQNGERVKLVDAPPTNLNDLNIPANVSYVASFDANGNVVIDIKSGLTNLIPPNSQLLIEQSPAESDGNAFSSMLLAGLKRTLLMVDCVVAGVVVTVVLLPRYWRGRRLMQE